MDNEKIKLKLIFWYSILWILIFVALYLSYFVYFPDLTSTKSKWVLLFSGAIALLSFACKYFEISVYKSKSTDAADILNINNHFFRYKYIVLTLFLLLIYSISYKYTNSLFIINAVAGILIYSFASKVSDNIILKSQTEPQTSKIIANGLLKLNFNSSTASIFLFWGLCAIGIIVLYYIFKDYELLIGFAFGFSTIAFLDNIINLLSENSFLNADIILNKYNNSALRNILPKFKIQNYAIFFEIFAIILVCAIAVGSNTLELMGAFLPIVASANIMFISIILLLLCKKSRLSDISKIHYKSIALVALLSNTALYFEIKYWLNADYCTIAYSTLFGSILAVILLFINKNKKYNSDINRIKNLSLSAILNVFLVLFLPFGVFLFADGLSAPMFGFYCAIMSLFGYFSIAPVTCAINNNENQQYLNNGYGSNLISVSFICAVLTFVSITKTDSVDILNPSYLYALFIGLLFSLFAIHNSAKSVSKQIKKIVLISKCQKKSLNVKYVIKKSIYNSSSSAIVLLLILSVLCYFAYKYSCVDYLFAFAAGAALINIPLIYNDDKVLSVLSATIVKYIGILLLAVSIIFV